MKKITFKLLLILSLFIINSGCQKSYYYHAFHGFSSSSIFLYPTNKAVFNTSSCKHRSFDSATYVDNGKQMTLHFFHKNDSMKSIIKVDSFASKAPEKIIEIKIQDLHNFNPLPFALIKIDGTDKFVKTDLTGNAILKLDSSWNSKSIELNVLYIGYKNLSIPITIPRKKNIQVNILWSEQSGFYIRKFKNGDSLVVHRSRRGGKNVLTLKKDSNEEIFVRKKLPKNRLK